MAVISISITESEDQIVAGIPKTITLTANIASTIFYTLDGSDPTISSDIYTSALYLPYNKPTVNLNIYATNGSDESPILYEEYQTNMLDNARLPRSATSAQPVDLESNRYPFGTPTYQPNGVFLNPGDAGVTVNNPALSLVSSTFDSDGLPDGYTNSPFDIENYQIVYSTTNDQHISNDILPEIIIQRPAAPANTSNQFTNTFDPRAMVIYQDFRDEDPSGPLQINRQFFSLDNPETSRDGGYFTTVGLSTPPLSGSFIKAHYNPKDNTTSQYFYDSWANRWIISKSEHVVPGNFDGNLGGSIVSNGGAKFVMHAIPFARRVLF